MACIVLLNGASGVGKTTTAKMLVEMQPSMDLIHPDELWDTPNMASEKILELAAQEALKQSSEMTVIDCQIRPLAIPEVLARYDVSWKLFLLDCPDDIREQRLLDRGWSNENFEKVAYWQSLLRTESNESGVTVLDTSLHSVRHCCEQILQELDECT